MISPSAAAAVDAVVGAAVVHGFGGAPPWPGGPVAPEAFERVVQIALNQRLLGVLAQAVTEGAFDVLPEQRERLAGHHTRWLAHSLGLERLLLEVVERFASAGIEVRVLKGAALAHLVYADPSWRVGADIDLLVPSDRFDDAVALAVQNLGGEQALPELRPGFDSEFGKESLVRVGPYELDLHRTFVTGPFGLTVDLDELFDDSTALQIGGREVMALGPVHQFLHACYNTALGDYPVRLCSVRDLLLCRELLDVDLDAVVAGARCWHGTAVVQRAAELVIEVAGPDVGRDFAELAALPVPRREAWLLRSYLTPARSYSRPLASLAVIKGVRPRLRYAHAIVAPSATYLRERGWSQRGHLRRALDRLRRRG
jgi:hypothetical protein